MRPLFSIISFLALCSVVVRAASQTGPSPSPSLAEVTIPRMGIAPRLEDFLEMRPTAELAGKLARLDGFIQRAPDEGIPATQPTEVYLGYDQKNLYVVFVAHDGEPKRMRARLDKRESFTLDEDQV